MGGFGWTAEVASEMKSPRMDGHGVEHWELGKPKAPWSILGSRRKAPAAKARKDFALPCHRAMTMTLPWFSSSYKPWGGLLTRCCRSHTTIQVVVVVAGWLAHWILSPWGSSTEGGSRPGRLAAEPSRAARGSRRPRKDLLPPPLSGVERIIFRFSGLLV